MEVLKIVKKYNYEEIEFLIKMLELYFPKIIKILQKQ